MLAGGPSMAAAAPSWASPSNNQRSVKSSYKTTNRKSNSQSRGIKQSQQSYRPPSGYNNKIVWPAPSKKGGRYTIDRRHGNKGGTKITGPFVPKPNDRKITGPFYPKPNDRKITDPFVPKPNDRKITGPFYPKPNDRKITDPFVPKPNDRKITGPFVPKPGVGGFNPKDLKPLPKIDDLSKGLKDFWKKGNKGKNQADLLKVKNFANKCFGFPAPCGWWVDFCCWNWWDWCCYPGYWDCWQPCYWDYVYCPSRVVVVNGVQQVLEEVSYYLGISGSQIPNFGFGIQQVKAASPAERAGLAAGDVIVSVNGRQMTGEEVLATAMQQANGVLDLELVSQGSDTPRVVRVVAERILTSSF
jgi:hypothetical protein